MTYPSAIDLSASDSRFTRSNSYFPNDASLKAIQKYFFLNMFIMNFILFWFNI